MGSGMKKQKQIVVTPVSEYEAICEECGVKVPMERVNLHGKYHGGTIVYRTSIPPATSIQHRESPKDRQKTEIQLEIILGTLHHKELRALWQILKNNDDIRSRLEFVLLRLLGGEINSDQKNPFRMRQFMSIFNHLSGPDFNDVAEANLLKSLSNVVGKSFSKYWFERAKREGFIYERRPGYWAKA